MDLHEELERRARVASAGAADRLGAAAAGDALVALVGRRRRRRAASFAGASVACVAAIVGAVAYVGPWFSNDPTPAGPSVTETTVIGASTPYVAAPFPSIDVLNVPCGTEYTAPSGASRQVDAADRWPLSITASASLSGGNDGVFTAAPGLVTWDVQVVSAASIKDLSLVMLGVVESDGLVVGSAVLGIQPLVGSGVVPTVGSPVPGACAAPDWHDSPDGDYTFHLWVQLIDADLAPVATVIDPVAPTTLNVVGIGQNWRDALEIDGLPNVEFDPLQCGDPSPVEGRQWEIGDYSASLPPDATMPNFTASIDAVDLTTGGASASFPEVFAAGSGIAPRMTVTLDTPLLLGAYSVFQGFGVVDGVVVAIGTGETGFSNLEFTQTLDTAAPCGVTAVSSMDVYVLDVALDYQLSTPQAAAVIHLGSVEVAPAAE